MATKKTTASQSHRNKFKRGTKQKTHLAIKGVPLPEDIKRKVSRKIAAHPSRGRDPANDIALAGGIVNDVLDKNPEAMPLQVLLAVMREKCPRGASLEVRRLWRSQAIDAAKAAAPYCHPKLNASVNPNDPKKPPVTDVNVRVRFVKGNKE